MARRLIAATLQLNGQYPSRAMGPEPMSAEVGINPSRMGHVRDIVARTQRFAMVFFLS
jgi:hypothetical protein